LCHYKISLFISGDIPCAEAHLGGNIAVTVLLWLVLAFNNFSHSFTFFNFSFYLKRVSGGQQIA
jgi:hypothetical protein